MEIRRIKLPEDFDLLKELIVKSFVYPENPAWDMEEDEIEGLAGTIDSLKKIWPLLRFIGLFSDTIKNILQGFIAEENGVPVGIFICQKRGSADRWHFSNVGVLPEFRRMGIARRLIEAAIDFVEKKSGKTIILDVKSKNVPAYSLYVDVGFKHYSGLLQMDCHKSEISSLNNIPLGIELIDIGEFDWETKYELMDLITPEEIKKFEPVVISFFKQSFVMRLLHPLVKYVRGTESVNQAIKTDGKIIGWINLRLRNKSGGKHGLSLYLDEDYKDLCESFVKYMLGKVDEHKEKREVITYVDKWQPHVVEGFQKAGFIIKMEGHRLGLIL